MNWGEKKKDWRIDSISVNARSSFELSILYMMVKKQVITDLRLMF